MDVESLKFCPLGGIQGGERLSAGLAVVLLLVAAPAAADKPIIDHQPVICSLPGKNPRVCALVADDGEIKRADVYFRAAGQDSFYRAPMSFDAVNYCATLPVPAKSVTRIEYYVRVIDNEAQVERTIDFPVRIEAASSCEAPVVDEDAERLSRVFVYATHAKQGKKIRLFEAKGIARFVPFGKR